MKRSRAGDSLTGGSGDVNPQWLVFPNLNTSNTDTYTQTQITLPVSRLPARGNKAMVIEVLRVWFDNPSFPGAFPATGAITQAQQQLATASLSSIQHASTAAFAFASQKWKGSPGGAEAYATAFEEPQELDLTDGNGHGILIATDTIFWGINTANFPAAASFNCRLLYRWKEVTLTEYIGMVQSQQVPGRASGT